MVGLMNGEKECALRSWQRFAFALVLSSYYGESDDHDVSGTTGERASFRNSSFHDHTVTYLRNKRVAAERRRKFCKLMLKRESILDNTRVEQERRRKILQTYVEKGKNT